MRGKAAIANAQLAYAAFQETFQGTRWEPLTAQGAKAAAAAVGSTGAKNPDYSDTCTSTEFIVADTVNTMPEKTLEAFADHGEVAGDCHRHRGAGPGGVRRPGAWRVDLTDVFQVLEDEGVQKFEASWHELLDTVKGQLDAVR